MDTYKSILDTIGKTPLIKLLHMGINLPGKILLKLEFFNPWGSVKDRIGLSMIESAEKIGLLKAGMEILEPTSGNTGIALAFIAAAKGYSLTLVMPESMSLERKTLLLMLGAKVILTPAELGMKGAIAKTKSLSKGNPNMYVPSQFNNINNPEIHRKTTAEEIWRDTHGQVDILISGVGTGGTITGVGDVLKQKKKSVEIIAVEPEESAVLSGEEPHPHKIAGIGAGFVPEILNTSIIDSIEKVKSDDAIAMARSIIKREGIPLGISSGAAMVAAMRIARLEKNRDKIIVVICPSYTERYLSTSLAEVERQTAMQMLTSSLSEELLVDK